MDFIDELKQFSKRAESMKDILPTEEATKSALIMPFFQLLGYDVFNPLEFMPEFCADVGIKKGEKVDYAIMLDGKPAILIEAKWCGEPLAGHDSQLFRYFGTTSAKFGILTNGILYKFYTDLDEPNKMDLVPFMEFNLLDIQESAIADVRRFSKEKMDIDAAFTAASELKYTGLIKAFLDEQRTSVSNSFVNYILGEVYTGRRTQAITEKFAPIIKKAYNSYINDVINDTLKSAMRSHEELPEPVVEEEAPKEEAPKIYTTAEELEAFIMIKTLLHDVISPDRLSYKDTESYFGIICDGSPRKWICRIKLDSIKNKALVLPDEKFSIESVEALFTFRDKIIASAKRFEQA